MKIAVAAYQMDELASFEAYAEKIECWVADAAADLLVFPEYGAMELATLSGRAGELEASLHAVSDLMEEADALHARLASSYGCHILAASGPVFDGDGANGRPVNRSRLFSPSGASAQQDKQIMTRFERETWDVVPGGPLCVFDTALGRIGVLICYDAEFPLLGRALVEAGAEILLVPSCTDSLHGWNRVRVGAMARALEGQCIAVQAPTVGACPWSPAVDENHGAAAIYGPPDLGFPEDGVFAQGKLDAAGWTRAEIDMGLVARVRAQGAQHNARHWPEQAPRAVAKEVQLR
ncbi:MAG: carbon-nitrogen hydrolase family protein [Pseudomonadota bacterium]